MKIRKVGTRKLTKNEIILDEIIEKKIANDDFGSLGLPPNATEIDMMKYSIVQDIALFKLATKMSQTEISKLIGVSKSRISEILHYHISNYSLDTLIKYLFSLKGHVEEVDDRIEQIAKTFKIVA